MRARGVIGDALPATCAAAYKVHHTTQLRETQRSDPNDQQSYYTWRREGTKSPTTFSETKTAARGPTMAVSRNQLSARPLCCRNYDREAGGAADYFFPGGTFMFTARGKTSRWLIKLPQRRKYFLAPIDRTIVCRIGRRSRYRPIDSQLCGTALT